MSEVHPKITELALHDPLVRMVLICGRQYEHSYVETLEELALEQAADRKRLHDLMVKVLERHPVAVTLAPREEPDRATEEA